MNRRISCFCAFCKSPRKIYARKHMGMIHVAGSAALTFTALFLFSDGELDLQAPILFSFFCLLAEVGVQLRWRMSIVCPFCGFDPALYLRNAQLAVAKVKARLAQRESDPRTLLTRQPKLNLHLRKVAPQRPGELLRAQRIQHLKQSTAANSVPPKSIPAARDFRLE